MVSIQIPQLSNFEVKTITTEDQYVQTDKRDQGKENGETFKQNINRSL